MKGQQHLFKFILIQYSHTHMYNERIIHSPISGFEFEAKFSFLQFQTNQLCIFLGVFFQYKTFILSDKERLLVVQLWKAQILFCLTQALSKIRRQIVLAELLKLLLRFCSEQRLWFLFFISFADSLDSSRTFPATFNVLT